MNSLSGFNSQEIRRLHPYLSALLRRIEALEAGTGIGGTKIIWGGGGDGGSGGGGNIQWGTDDDILPTGDRNSGGTLGRVARADHQHLFRFPTTVPPFTPDGSAYFDPSASAISVYVNDTPTTRVVAGATTADVQPTGTANTGTAPRYSFADHSHPTALLPQNNSQTPVVGEIRYNADNKLVRWSGSAWVELSVETIEAGTDSDVQPTRLRSAGASTRFARADHSHPTALLPQGDAQTPVPNEVRFNTDNKVVRWDGTTWVPLSVETFTIDWGTDSDVQPTRLRSTGTATRFARSDHSHPTAILPQSDAQTPVVDEIRFDTDNKVVRWDGSAWVPLSVETFTIEWGTNADVQPTRLQSTGSSTRVARADHSHPTAILPQSDTQTPVENEIRFTANDKIVRWDGSDWVPLSVETGGGEAGTEADVQPTRLQSAGASLRYARADHSHPTAILPQSDAQTPVIDEIRYNADNKIVRWNGSNWVELSVEYLEAGETSDVQPTRLRSAGTSARYARANHSHPTALLPQSNSQTPVVDEIRYTPTNRLVRWIGSSWVDFIGALPVPADPLILPFDNQVSSPQNRQLVNRTAWDNIGNATVFYYDANNNQYRLVFARPLVVATTSTPSGKDVWSNQADELVIKEGTGTNSGGILLRRRGFTTEWSPVSIQLSSGFSLPTDIGVLARSGMIGTSGSRRWFIRGAIEDGSFRAPFAGIATFTASTAPAPANLATNLNDAYAYYLYDFERVDIVRPIAGGSSFPTMLTHFLIAPQCRVFSTASDPNGHYVRDELWNEMWVMRFYTTTTASTDLVAVLPTFAVPFGIQAGRVVLYLYNPQSFAISTVFSVAVRRPTSTTPITSATSDTIINIPANTAVAKVLGVLTFAPSDTLPHNRSHILSISIIRRRTQESSNSNSVMCLGLVIVPERT